MTSTAEIIWGEDDVRDAMAEFDPAAKDWCGATEFHVGVYGRRPFGTHSAVAVFAYWMWPNSRLSNTVFADGQSVYFDDPIEAIAFAISELRRLKSE